MVNWSAIDTVLLDMDGTLLDLHFDNHFWLEHLPLRYAQQHGCELDEARKHLHNMSEALHGSLNWYCIDYWSDNLDMDVAALKREVQHLIRFRPGTVEFLDFLQNQGKACMLVTNAHPKALALKLQASGLGAHVPVQISAHTFQLAKENEGFWQSLQQHTGLDYARCLFIDDSLNVLRCAREGGLQHVLQVLQPDTTQAPRALSEFPGLGHFQELMA
mgnify:CR=1 FL=1